MDSGMGEDFTYVPSYFIDPDIASKTGWNLDQWDI